MQKSKTMAYAMTTPDGLIQLARTGRFYREDHGGSFTVTKRQLLEMRDNAIDRGLDIPVKYTHDGNTYAAGWVDCMSLSVQPMGTHGQGLFGKARWTEDAKGQLDKGALKYISPEIVWAAKRMADTKRGMAGDDVGAMLVGAALVLTPFFDMAPVSLFSALTQGTRGAEMYSHMMSLVSPDKLSEVSEMLKANGIAEDKSMGLAAQLMLSMVREMVKGDEMPAAEMPEGETETEIELELPAAEMQAEGELMVKELLPQEQPMAEMGMGMDKAKGLMASIERVKSAFGLKATASTEALVLAAEAQRKAYSALQSRLGGLEKAEAERQRQAAQATFAKYESEGRFRFQASDSDPKGVDAAKKIFAKGIDVFDAVFGGVQPLSAFAAAAPKAPAAPSAGKRFVDPSAVPASEIQSYMAQHNVNYGEALKALLVSK
jgi:phage I-like protein